ncbi:hypothetical protein Ancab_032718 [Ancistrocladus abbreviatus]
MSPFGNLDPSPYPSEHSTNPKFDCLLSPFICLFSASIDYPTVPTSVCLKWRNQARWPCSVPCSITSRFFWTSHVSNAGGKSVYPQTQPPIEEPILQEPKRDKVRLNCSLPIPPIVLPSYLSIGATLSTAPCLPISPDLTTPLVSGLDFGLPPTPFVPPLYEGVPDENMATLLITNVNEKIEGNALLDQILYPPHRTENIDMNSNDTVLKNLKQLDVENSSSEGPSINSSDLKRKKKDNESRSS